MGVFLFLMIFNNMEDEELRNEAYDNVDILYEDDNLLFVKLYSLSSVKYFGPEWLVDDYRLYMYGGLFLVYDKDDNKKFVIHQPKENQVTVTEDGKSEFGLGVLSDLYPQLNEKLIDVFGYFNIYTALSAISKGVDIRSGYLEELDELVYDIKFNKSFPELSKITLKFNDFEDYLSLFDLDQNDVWLIENLFSYYGQLDNWFYTEDLGNDDWSYGYLLHEFNDENQNKVKEIISYIRPDLLGSNNFNEEVSKVLGDFFDSEVDDIIYEYVLLQNECREESMKEDVKKDLNGKKLNPYHIIEITPFVKYIVTPKHLMRLFESTNLKNGKIKDVLTVLVSDWSYGGYYDSIHETDCLNFDYERFNREVEYRLEKMLDEVIDGDLFYDITGYREIIDKVVSKYDFHKRHDIPKNPDIQFSIDTVDKDTNKIKISIYKRKYGGVESRMLTLDEFYSFLYNYELFENVRKKF